MTYTVYVLRSKEGHTYAGITDDIERRLSEHNSGYSKYIRKGTEWKIVYQEEVDARDEARRRDKYLKSHAGKE